VLVLGLTFVAAVLSSLGVALVAEQQRPPAPVALNGTRVAAAASSHDNGSDGDADLPDLLAERAEHLPHNPR
jgi:hypothetical protein